MVRRAGWQQDRPDHDVGYGDTDTDRDHDLNAIFHWYAVIDAFPAYGGSAAVYTMY